MFVSYEVGESDFPPLKSVEMQVAPELNIWFPPPIFLGGRTPFIFLAFVNKDWLVVKSDFMQRL